MNANGLAIFPAYRPDTGTELWRSDGTATGTTLLKDICPGEASGVWVPTEAGHSTSPLTVVNGQVYFVGNDCVSGEALWTSDGTPAGTHRVKDVDPEPNWSGSHALVSARESATFFFNAFDGAKDTIWRSDGTEAGTVSTGVAGTPLFRTSKYIFFSATEGNVCKLKQMPLASNDVSDVAPICPSGVDLDHSDATTSIAAGTNIAYFTARDNTTGVEVWRTDGTPAGTFMQRDIWPGAESSQPSHFFVDSSDQLFFSATDGFFGQEVWLSDGSTANTFRLKDINSGLNGSDPADFAQWKGVVYFTAYDGTQRQLWRTDGRGDGTRIFKDLAPNVGPLSSPELLTPTSNALFFTASDDAHRHALFKIDSVQGVVELVKDIDPTTTNSKIDLAMPFGNGIFFAGDDGVHGSEPWVSDGTDGGTHMLANIVGPATVGTRPTFVAPLGGQALVMRPTGAKLDEPPQYVLGASDGTAGGTHALKTFSNAPADLSDSNKTPAVVGGALYFAATGTFTQGEELWRSDGTAGGTVLVAGATTLQAGSQPQWLTPSGQTLYFSAHDTTYGIELWKTGRTAGTTTLVKDIWPGGSAIPQFLTPDGTGGVFFAADDGTHGRELWHSDGTDAGTQMLIDLQPGAGSSDPQSLTRVGANLFFTAHDGSSGRELWVTNGTPEGTHLVRDITPGPGGTDFEPSWSALPVLGNRVLFVASSSLYGHELWASDGTESGTAIVKDVYSGPLSSDIEELTPLNGALYFTATAGNGTRTLWRSDGTPKGTQPVVSGPNAPANPEALSAIGDQLYFSAVDDAHGRELWVSDGSSRGTHMLQDLNPGRANSNPRDIIAAGDHLFLNAYAPAMGVQLWAAQIAPQTLPGQTPLPTPTPTPPSQASKHHVYLSMMQR